VGAQALGQWVARDIWGIEETAADRGVEVLQCPFGLFEERSEVDKAIVAFAVHHDVLFQFIKHLRNTVAICVRHAGVRATKRRPHNTTDGTVELDASIMDGKTMKAGGIAVARHIKNPISLARIVLEKTPHVLVAGEGVTALAQEMGVPWVPESYFYTEDKWNELSIDLEAGHPPSDRRGQLPSRPETDRPPAGPWHPANRSC